MNLSRNKNLKFYVYSLILILTGCQTVPDKPADIINELDDALNNKALTKQRALTAIPNAVQQDLIHHNIAQARHGLLEEKRLEVSANNVAAKDFFAALVEESPYSIIVHPDVSGNITVNLKDITVIDTLNAIETLYGYDIKLTGKIFQVYPSGIRTETIALDYLFIKRGGTSNTSVNSSGVTDEDSGSNSSSSNNNSSNGNNSSSSGSSNKSGVNVYTENESDFWTELENSLTSLIGTDDGRVVTIAPQAGLVTVKAYPAEIKAIKKFLKASQEHLRRQVIIEAKILEVTLNDDYQQGIRWDQISSNINSTSLVFGQTGNIASNIISSTFGGESTITVNNDDFSGVISFLQTQGNVQVLSSPRITATNNQKAVIKVGQDEFFVTEVSSTTTTGTATTTTPEIELTPFFSGIALDVTPQIDEHGEVILHVHPSVTETAEQIKTITINDEDFSLPLAQSNIRESDSIIRAKSGEIVVLGGLIESRKVHEESKTPLLGDIPFVGELFKSKSESTQKSELVIMLKPIVTGHDAWQEQLQDARDLLKQWFPEEK